MNWRIAMALAAILAVHPLAASAQPIPEPVKAMIAAAAYPKFLAGEFAEPELSTEAGWQLR